MTKKYLFAALIDSYLLDHPGEHQLIDVGKAILGDDFSTHYKSLTRAARKQAELGRYRLEGNKADTRILMLDKATERPPDSVEERLAYDHEIVNMLLYLEKQIAIIQRRMNKLTPSDGMNIQRWDDSQIGPFRKAAKACVPSFAISQAEKYEEKRRIYDGLPVDRIPAHLHEWFRRRESEDLRALERSLETKQAEREEMDGEDYVIESEASIKVDELARRKRDTDLSIAMQEQKIKEKKAQLGVSDD